MGRKPCCEKSSGLKRGPWTIEEDHKLINFILNNGIQCWRVVPKLAGLQRCGKSCRLRWINYLRPDLKRGALTEAEEDMIIQLHSRLGNRWSKIAAHFPGRTDNEIKNHWNTRIKKKLKSQGVDPLTHRQIEEHENHCNSNQEEGRVLMHSSSATEMMTNNLNVLQDYQMGSSLIGKEMFNSGMEKETNFIASNSNQFNGSTTTNMGLNLMMTHQIDPLNKFTLEFGEGDFLPNWIDSPFQWDAFENPEEDIL